MGKSNKQQQRGCLLPITSLPTTWQSPFLFYPDLDVLEQVKNIFSSTTFDWGTPCCGGRRPPVVDEEDKAGDEVEVAPLVDSTRPGRELKSSSASVYHLSLGWREDKEDKGEHPTAGGRGQPRAQAPNLSWFTLRLPGSETACDRRIFFLEKMRDSFSSVWLQ